MSAEQARKKFAAMGGILGMQDITVSGVPGESHFAELLVEADIRMKRLSIGVDPPPVRGFKSHLSFAGPDENTMQRWWFAPLYDAFTRSADGLAFQFAGQRVQLMSQEELVSDSGQRMNAATTRVSAQKFARQFTDRYAEIAEAEPVFADLQNLFDLAVLAALLRKERIPEQIGWGMTLFLDAERAAVSKRHVPRQVASISNYKAASSRLYTAQVGGGVLIDGHAVLAGNEFRGDSGGKLAEQRTAAVKARAARWWWD
jgi:hypothetical protein